MVVEDNNRAKLQAEIDQIDWYHEFDFGNGLKTKSRRMVDSHRPIWKFISENLDLVNFQGKSVIDIGSWDGYWSFEAEKRGAKSVLSTDDLSQNGAKSAGITLAKKLLGSQIDINQHLSVYNLDSLKQKFDVILFLGVYYHLHDPFYALSQIRHCCHEDSLVVIDGPVGLAMPYNSAIYDFNYHPSEFLPGMGALNQLIEATYLRPVETRFIFPESSPKKQEKPGIPKPQGTDGPIGRKWRLQMALQSIFGSKNQIQSMVEQALPTQKQAPQIFLDTPTGEISSNRIFTVCKPFSGENKIHLYKPPFGLAAYDSRSF